MKILSTVSHPCIVRMLGHIQNPLRLYMLFEYVAGGELFSHLRAVGVLKESAARFYACEIVLALEYLHGLGIIYRDLKPENLLLTAQGHIKITDFGFAKAVADRTYSLCGTPDYLAPEIVQQTGHNKAVDWWALGILIFEMLAGFPPFTADTQQGIYAKITAGDITWPRFVVFDHPFAFYRAGKGEGRGAYMLAFFFFFHALHHPTHPHNPHTHTHTHTRTGSFHGTPRT